MLYNLGIGLHSARTRKQKTTWKKKNEKTTKATCQQPEYLLHVFRAANERERDREGERENDWQSRSGKYTPSFLLFCIIFFLLCRVTQITRACVQTNSVSNSIVSFTGDRMSWSHLCCCFSLDALLRLRILWYLWTLLLLIFLLHRNQYDDPARKCAPSKTIQFISCKSFHLSCAFGIHAVFVWLSVLFLRRKTLENC